MKSMKRKSFIITILVSFWVCYAIVSIVDFSLYASKQMTPYVQKVKENIDFHVKTVQRYLFFGDIEGVKEYLIRAHKKKELNFGVLNLSGKTIFSFNHGQVFDGPDPDTDRDFKIFDEFVESEQIVYKTVVVDNVKITLGANKLDLGFLTSELMNIRYRMLANFGLITLLVGVLLYLIMKDVISLTKAIEENDWAAVNRIGARSKEGSALIRVATGLKGLFDRSQSWNKKLEHAVAPALLRQIENEERGMLHDEFFEQIKNQQNKSTQEYDESNYSNNKNQINENGANSGDLYQSSSKLNQTILGYPSSAKDAKELEVKSPEIKSLDTKLSESKTLESKSPEVKTLEIRPTENKTQDSKTIDSNPPEIKPPEIKPSESKPPEVKASTSASTSITASEMKTFEQILVTMDWNDHTELFFKSGMPVIDEIRNKAFATCDILIKRYGGLRLESQGDSLTFSFEKKNGMNTKAMALACVRDIFSALEKLESEFVKAHYSDKNITLKFKAAMVDGRFEFKKTAIDYKLSSAAWYEAARAMSNVTHKDRNSLVILSRDQADLDVLANFSEPREVVFKGFPQPVSVMTIESFKPIEEVYLSSQKADKLRLFRNDLDIAKIIRSIEGLSTKAAKNESAAGEKKKSIADLMQTLREFKIFSYTAGNIIPETYNSALRNIAEKGDDETLAGFVLIACNLIVRDQMSHKIVQTLMRLENHSNRRVAANLMDALRALTDDTEWAEKYLDSDDNRILGNALMILGSQSVDRVIVSRIEKLLRSSRPHFVATGIFVQCFLYLYHFQINQVYCKTNEFLRETPMRIKTFANHKDIMVQKRARESLAQIGAIEKGYFQQSV